MAKAMFTTDMPSCCLHCELRSVIYADGQGYQHCGFDKNGYKLETFFKTEDLKEGFVSSFCPLRKVPEKKEDNLSIHIPYNEGYLKGWNDCIDDMLGGGE